MTAWDDKDFEELLKQELTQLPPDDEVVDQTNPWEEPVTRIALGLALTTIKLNFLWLEFLLPTVGYLMLLLGFRVLRRENRWFAAGWGLSVLRVVGWVVSLVEAATGWRGVDMESIPGLMLLSLGLQVGYFLILRKALMEVFRKAEVPWQEDPLLLLAGLTAAMAVLALSPLKNSWLAALPTLIFYVYACKTLYGLPGKLSNAGYALTATPVRVSERTVKRVYWLLCLAIVVVGSLWSGHIILEGVVDTAPRSAPVRRELAELGFPEEQLRELPDEELEGLDGAIFVDVSNELLMFDPHSEPEYNSYGLVYQYMEAPGKSNLDVTSVAVERPDHTFRIFVFFEWKSFAYGADHSPFWTDGFSFIMDDGDEKLPYGGALRYEKEGQTWTAPIPGLTMGEVSGQGFFGPYTNCRISGKVNYPMGAEDRRGWLRADFTPEEDQWLGCMILNWGRNTAPRFPYADPAESNDFTFRDRRQFYTTFETLNRYNWEQAGEPEEWP